MVFFEGLCTRNSIPLPVYLQPVHNAIVNTLYSSLASENVRPTSVLVFGSRSSGKSLVSERAISSLRCKIGPLHIITLHGLLHNTPTRAWRHVASKLQICLSSEPENITKSSVEECLGIISSTLNQIRKQGIAIIFVLDDFERFVNSYDGMLQTVLYSLLNFLQDMRLRGACIAMTSVIDVIDGLEKRVKSRFAHREIVVTLPSNAIEVLCWVKKVLFHSTEHEEQASREKLEIEPGEKLVSRTKRKRRRSNADRNGSSKTRKLAVRADYREKEVGDERQTCILTGLLQHKECIDMIDKKLARSRVVDPILNAIDMTIACMREDNWGGKQEEKKVEHVIEESVKILRNFMFPYDSNMEMIVSLSALEVALLTALRKMEVRNMKSKCKMKAVFRDVFEEYSNLSNPVKGMLRGERDGEPTLPLEVAEKGWERLVEYGLIVRVGSGARDVRGCYVGVEGSIVDEGLQNHGSASTAMKKWGRSR